MMTLLVWNHQRGMRMIGTYALGKALRQQMPMQSMTKLTILRANSTFAHTSIVLSHCLQHQT